MTKSAKDDPLKDQLDALALAILGKVLNEGEIIEVMPQSVAKAVDVLKNLGGWYAIKNKVNPDLGDKEGEGIDGFKDRLSGAIGAVGAANGLADQGAEGNDDRAGLIARHTAGRPDRKGTKPGDPDNTSTTERANRSRRRASGSFPEDDGGGELAGVRQRLPINVGSLPNGEHGTGGAADAAPGGADRGRLGVENPGESDLDRLVDQ